MGLANVAGAFCQSMPVMAALSRSAVNSEAGARSQVRTLLLLLLLLLLLMMMMVVVVLVVVVVLLVVVVVVLLLLVVVVLLATLLLTATAALALSSRCWCRPARWFC